jgi:hypothetical protein
MLVGIATTAAVVRDMKMVSLCTLIQDTWISLRGISHAWRAVEIPVTIKRWSAQRRDTAYV